MGKPDYLRSVGALAEDEAPTSLVSKVRHGIRHMIRSEGPRAGDPELPSSGVNETPRELLK
jgi:hypothetical protein